MVTMELGARINMHTSVRAALSKLHANNLEGGLESSLSTLTRGQGLRLSFVRLGKVV